MTTLSTPPAGPLLGLRLLIVEDQAIIALDLENLLADQGAGFVGWARSIAQARELLRSAAPFHAVLLDLHLGEESGVELIEDLVAGGVAIVLTSGFAGNATLAHEGLRQAPLVAKPYRAEDVVAALVGVAGMQEQTD